MKQKSTWEYIKQQNVFSPDVIDMAKKLGINPRKLQCKTHYRQSPSPEFIRHLYAKRFKNPQDSSQD